MVVSHNYGPATHAPEHKGVVGSPQDQAHQDGVEKSQQQNDANNALAGGSKRRKSRSRRHKKHTSHKKRSHRRNRHSKGGFMGIGKMLGLTKEKPLPEATPVPTVTAVPVAPKPTQKRLQLGLGSGIYKGEMEYGMANGQGTWTSNDNVYVIEGLWKNDKASDTKMKNTKSGKVYDYPPKQKSGPSAFEQTAIASGYSQEQLANLRAKENAPVSQGGKSRKSHKKHKTMKGGTNGCPKGWFEAVPNEATYPDRMSGTQTVSALTASSQTHTNQGAANSVDDNKVDMTTVGGGRTKRRKRVHKKHKSRRNTKKRGKKHRK